MSPLLPPPPSSKRPVIARGGSIDYLSGDIFDAGTSSLAAEPPEPFSVRSPPRNPNPASSYSPSFSPSPPHHFTNSNSSPAPMFDKSPMHDELIEAGKSERLPAPLFDKSPMHGEPIEAGKSSERNPLGTWDSPSPPGPFPPPPKTNQRQNYFDRQSYPTGMSNSSSGSSSPYNGLAGQTQNLSLNTSGAPKQENQEDALFKDLVDFARSKSNKKSF